MSTPTLTREQAAVIRSATLPFSALVSCAKSGLVRLSTVGGNVLSVTDAGRKALAVYDRQKRIVEAIDLHSTQ